MRALAAPGPEGPANSAPADPGRQIWAASGLVVAAALIVGTALLLAPASGGPANGSAQPQSFQGVSAPGPVTATTTVTVPQLVTSLTVLSYGGPVQVVICAGDTCGTHNGMARFIGAIKKPGVACAALL